VHCISRNGIADLRGEKNLPRATRANLIFLDFVRKLWLKLIHELDPRAQLDKKFDLMYAKRAFVHWSVPTGNRCYDFLNIFAKNVGILATLTEIAAV
jgi:hypothetical protein